MNTIFKKLPLDCINEILSYDERFAIRRGIPVDRILKTDERYRLLLSMPLKKYNHPYSKSSRVYIIINPNKDLSISYNIVNNNHWINVMFVSYVFDDDNSGNGHIDFPKSINHKFMIC